MERRITYLIDWQDDGLTIEQYLKRKHFSGQNIKDMKKYRNNAMVNGSECIMKHILSSGDTLEVLICDMESSRNIPPVELPLDIIYEDEDILVVNKPAGLPTHPSHDNYYYSLANALAWYYQNKGETFVFRCTNRLDRDTSGLTVISKHFVSAGILSSMVKGTEMKRQYLAVACGSVSPLRGTIDVPLARKPGRIIERCADFENGERAVTHYSVIEEKNGYSLVSLLLETGRTHQIRAHMKYLGYPLAGDSIYNPCCSAASETHTGNIENIPGSEYSFIYVPIEINGISRQALHSYRLQFPHPITRKMMEFTAPLPEDMQVFGFMQNPGSDPANIPTDCA